MNQQLLYHFSVFWGIAIAYLAFWYILWYNNFTFIHFEIFLLDIIGKLEKIPMNEMDKFT